MRPGGIGWAHLGTAPGAPTSGPAAPSDLAPKTPGRRPALHQRVATLVSVSRCARIGCDAQPQSNRWMDRGCVEEKNDLLVPNNPVRIATRSGSNRRALGDIRYGKPDGPNSD